MTTTSWIVFASLLLVFLSFVVLAVTVSRLKKPATGVSVPSASAGSSLPPRVEAGIPGEVVAAIAAAVAVLEGGNVTVRSIRRERVGRPSWAAAGILENTRPF